MTTARTIAEQIMNDCVGPLMDPDDEQAVQDAIEAIIATALTAARAEAEAEVRASYQRVAGGAGTLLQAQLQEIATFKAERDAARAELAKLQEHVDRFWFHVEHAYDIEPREYFEGNPPDASVFGSPLAQAAHHIWKRDPKVQSAKAEGAREALEQAAAEIEGGHSTHWTREEISDWLRARAQEGR